MTWILDLAALGIGDVAEVGGKTAAIGELMRLAPQGVAVPGGFAIAAGAYREALDRAGAWERLHALLDGLDPTDVRVLSERAAKARAIVFAATGSSALRQEIVAAWRRLSSTHGPGLTVAVRSSATAEDLPTASFAGQHESFLNVRGEAAVVEACRRCFASIFTDRAIVYRIQNGFDHFEVSLSVAVMTMVRAAASGVIFSLDTESGFDGVVYLTGAWGVGETLVQGRVEPDEFYVHKPTWRLGRRAVLRRRLGAKALQLAVVGAGARSRLVERRTTRARRRRFCLADAEVLSLAGAAMAIEDHFGRAMDIEWAKEEATGQLFILQARPETAASRRASGELTTWRLKGDAPTLLTGAAVGERIASGAVRVIASAGDLEGFRDGEVLVARTTSPDWEAVMRRAAAIVTETGGRTCHAAILARELGVPAVVGAAGATSRLVTGVRVTVDCAQGAVGRVLSGDAPFAAERTVLAELKPTRTKVMLNLGDPDAAFTHGALPVAGVGLARMEFIIARDGGVHPMAAAHPDRLSRRKDQTAIARFTADCASPAEAFVRRVSEGVGTIAAAFWPRPVVVRLSDFKSNEYARLVGGRDFEPVEANPMLGYRGAVRYVDPGYADGFALECAALRRARETMGLTNIRLMIPFCRRVGEAEAVLAALAANGLVRGRDGLEVWVMCEIPNNVIQIDAFAALFDGFSIGSNDLTQLVLGADRDGGRPEFDERDPGVMDFVRQAIAGAHRNRRPIGICGEAPATWPEFANAVIVAGVDSVSVNPDSAIGLMRRIGELERSPAPAPADIPVAGVQS